MARFRGKSCLFSHRRAVFQNTAEEAGLPSTDRDLQRAEIALYRKAWVKKQGPWVMHLPVFEALSNNGAEGKEGKRGTQKEERWRQFLRSYEPT